MTKVAVIGCNSFTGSYVVDELLAAGDCQVLGVDRQENTPTFLSYLARDVSNFRFFKADLNADLERLKACLLSEQPDYVMNLAALGEVAPSWHHPAHWMRTNVVALTELADSLRKLPKLAKFVQISTPEVYGSVRGKIDEAAPLNPSSPYAVSKAAFDLLLNTFHRNYGFPVVYMRAGNVYGPGQKLFKIVPRTVIYLKLGKTLRLHGGGTAVRSYVHVRDAARAYIAGMFRGRAGEVYHISPDETVEVRELVKRICEKMNRDFDRVTRGAGVRRGHDDAYMLDSSKARRELGWSPEVSLSQGIDETIAWVAGNWRDIRRSELEYVHRP